MDLTPTKGDRGDMNRDEAYRLASDTEPETTEAPPFDGPFVLPLRRHDRTPPSRVAHRVFVTGRAQA